MTFNPDPVRLARQVQSLRSQVDEILIVDNGSTVPPGAIAESEGVRMIALAENVGVASGFNIGMREARATGAEFALLLDHDSVPLEGMVAKLLEGYRKAQKSCTGPIAAVGPRVVDPRERSDYPFIRLGWMRNDHVRCDRAVDGVVECDFLITSGSLVAVEHLEDVGELDDSLFIDSVDFEWCCRARARGFHLVGVCDARLDHRLGDDRRRVVGGLALVVHSPQRLYYMTRNRMLLYRRSYVPLKWKLKDVLRLGAKFAATMALLPPRRAYARMTWHAICDGLAGRGGRR